MSRGVGDIENDIGFVEGQIEEYTTRIDNLRQELGVLRNELDKAMAFPNWENPGDKW